MELLLVWVGLGSAAGGLSRHMLSVFLAARLPGPFPLGTLLVNTTGAFLLAGLLRLTGGGWEPRLAPPWELALTFGFLGGYTTVSSYSQETLNLAVEAGWSRAALYAIGTVVLCLTSAALGWLMASWASGASGAFPS
jgi:fluoride exporter